MAYRADIEIGVKGARSLEQLRSSINLTATTVDSLNDVVSARGSLVQNIENYTNNLNRAARSLERVGAGTEAETKAIREYVQALGEANTARARQNSLVAQEIANQRRVTPGNAGVGQQGPALPPALIEAQKVRQKWTQFFIDAEDLATDLQVSATAKGLNTRTKWTKFFDDASGVAQDLQAATQQQAQDTKNSWAKFFTQAVEVAEDLKSITKARGLNTRTSWTVFFQEAADTAKSIQATVEQKAALVKSSWSMFFDDAAQVAEDMRARTAQIRSAEAAASSAARQRLAQTSNRQAGEVIRRPISGPAYAEPAGPGGAGVTRASAVAAEAALRKVLDLQLKTATAAGSWATALQLGSRWLNEDLQVTSALLRANDRLLQSTNAQTAARKQLAKVKIFETQQAANVKRTGELNESIALGVGFPLLFGGGAGSIAGSFAGSFAGKGFGGQIIGGAIGQVIDNFIVGLTKVTSSLEETTKAAGISGTALEKNIEALREAGQEEKAMELATQALARVVGSDGVRALSEFERAGTELANAFQKLGVQLQALAAELLGPTAKGIAGAVEDTVLIRQAEKSGDPRQIADIQARNKAFGDEYYAIQERILNRQRELNKEFENQTVSIEKNVNTSAQSVRVLEAQIELAKTDGDLTNDKVFKLREAVIQKEFEKALQDAINNGTSSEVAQLERKLKLTQLATNRQEAFAKASEKAAKAGRNALDIQKAILGLQTEAIQTALQAGDIDIERARVTKGEAAALAEEIGQLDARFNLEARSLDLRTQQQLLAKELTGTERTLIESIYREQLTNLREQYKTRREILIQAEAQRLLEQAIADAQAMQQARQPFEDIRQQRELEVQYGKTYLRLVSEGMLPSEAQRIANYEKITAEQIKQLDLQIAMAEEDLNRAKTIGVIGEALEQYRTNLERLQKARGAALSSAALGPGEGKSNRERLQDEIATVQGQLNTLLDPINQITTAAEGIGLAFSDSFKGIISGTMTAQEALAGFFQNVADQFLDMAAQIIAKWIQLTILNSILRIFPGTPAAGGGSAGLFGAGSPDAIAGGGIFSGAGPYQFRANGGSVSAGSPYIVGERGPELFVPGRSGTIVPNDKMGGDNVSVVVNVDAKGTSVQGNDQQGNQLGRAISAAVQQELIKQKRPGGLLA